jgi:hypothetical protein
MVAHGIRVALGITGVRAEHLAQFLVGWMRPTLDLIIRSHME